VPAQAGKSHWLLAVFSAYNGRSAIGATVGAACYERPESGGENPGWTAGFCRNECWGCRAGALNDGSGSSGGCGWSDSHQWVGRFAPVGGAIRTSGWGTWPHDGNPRPLGILVICRLSPPNAGRSPGPSALTGVWHTVCGLFGVY